MESTRPIRALARGLDALSVLNLRNGATVSEVAHEIRLPRTTVYRILETLTEAGCAFRDPADERYRLTAKVRGLSSGFVDEDWVRNTAAPCIARLGAQIVWPVSISTLTGTLMLLRASTDHTSPLAIERFSAGFRFGLLDSASGRVYLAHCSAERRDALLAVLAQSKKPEDRPARDAAEIERLLFDVKSRGYALMTRTRRAQEDVAIAVPVLRDGAVFAVLGVRVAAAAMPPETALERFLPRLRECARDIGARCSGNQ